MNDVIPAFVVICALIIILGFVVIMRYINYKENLAMAEKGITRPEHKNGKGFLRWGIVTAALGLAFTIGLYTAGFSTGDEFPFHLGPWMLGGFVPLFLGLGLILLHYLTGKD